MKVLIASTLLFASLFAQADCNSTTPLNSTTSNQEPAKMLLAFNQFNSKTERSGCCSWHGGVCGCSSGRARCCDGSLSPSCGC